MLDYIIASGKSVKDGVASYLSVYYLEGNDIAQEAWKQAEIVNSL